MLNLIHEGHLGMVKCKTLARGSVYWPGLTNDIVQLVQKCDVCCKYSQNNKKQPLMPHEVVEYPFEKVAVDMFMYKSSIYLFLIVYYSKFIEMALVSNRTNSANIIVHLKSIFARHGIPLKLMSDNGPPFNSLEFRSFMREWDIEHVTSSPYHSKSNGLVENAVKTIKNIFRKSEEENTDPYIGLLNFRNCAKNGLYSPAELLFSRNLRSKMPVVFDKLEPKLIDKKLYNSGREKSQVTMKENHDRSTGKELSDLQLNQSVYFKKVLSDSYWLKGVIVEVLSNPRSYVISSNEDNTLYRRNRIFIKIGHTDDDNERTNYTNKNNNNRNNLMDNGRPKRVIKRPVKLNL